MVRKILLFPVSPEAKGQPLSQNSSLLGRFGSSYYVLAGIKTAIPDLDRCRSMALRISMVTARAFEKPLK
jgi:hypothetical protein